MYLSVHANTILFGYVVTYIHAGTNKTYSLVNLQDLHLVCLCVPTLGGLFVM